MNGSWCGDLSLLLQCKRGGAKAAHSDLHSTGWSAAYPLILYYHHLHISISYWYMCHLICLSFCPLFMLHTGTEARQAAGPRTSHIWQGVTRYLAYLWCSCCWCCPPPSHSTHLQVSLITATPAGSNSPPDINNSSNPLTNPPQLPRTERQPLLYSWCWSYYTTTKQASNPSAASNNPSLPGWPPPVRLLLSAPFCQLLEHQDSMDQDL